MKRTYSIFFISSLLINCLLFSTSWGQTVLKPVLATDPVTLAFEGVITDAATHQPIANATIAVKNSAGAVSTQQRVGTDGAFKLTLRSRDAFQVLVTATGYETLDKQYAPTSRYTDRISNHMIVLYRVGTKPPDDRPLATNAAAPVHANTSTVSPAPVSTPPVSEQPATSNAATATQARVTPPKTLDAKITYVPPLVVAPTGKTTQLKAIQFVQSKAELLPDAMPALEQLLMFMQSKPTAEIELSGHTDNQGDFDENIRLSKQRVDLVKAYLVQNGIAANRITTRGYGPTRPIASNNSETTRQLNRRVEMIVLKQ
ncbi:OmpA family protein [Spirosoma koreense]